MKLLKIIVIIFLIYFVRRFFQMYQMMKTIQENQLKNPPGPSPEMKADPKDKNVVDADFKVMD